MIIQSMTNERLEYLLTKALKYIDPSLLGLTTDEACYLGVPGTYTAPPPVMTAHWVDRGGGYECSRCGKWVKDRTATCPTCGAWIII